MATESLWMFFCGDTFPISYVKNKQKSNDILSPTSHPQLFSRHTLKIRQLTKQNPRNFRFGNSQLSLVETSALFYFIYESCHPRSRRHSGSEDPAPRVSQGTGSVQGYLRQARWVVGLFVKWWDSHESSSVFIVSLSLPASSCQLLRRLVWIPTRHLRVSDYRNDLYPV